MKLLCGRYVIVLESLKRQGGRWKRVGGDRFIFRVLKLDLVHSGTDTVGMLLLSTSDMLNWGKRGRNKRSGSGRCQAWRSVSAPPMVAPLELALLLLSNSMLEWAETDKFFGSKMTRWHQRQSRVRWWRSCLYRERCEWILNLEQVDVQAAEAYFFSKDQLRIELKENGQPFEFFCDSGACKTVLTERPKGVKMSDQKIIFRV